LKFISRLAERGPETDVRKELKVKSNMSMKIKSHAEALVKSNTAMNAKGFCSLDQEAIGVNRRSVQAAQFV
jgi:hypothetical protein